MAVINPHETIMLHEEMPGIPDRQDDTQVNDVLDWETPQHQVTAEQDRGGKGNDRCQQKTPAKTLHQVRIPVDPNESGEVMCHVENHEDPDHRNLAVQATTKEFEGRHPPDKPQDRGHDDQEVIGNRTKHPVLPWSQRVKRAGNRFGHTKSLLAGKALERERITSP